jgi:LDH2 family malate/lactate/ureidoglycolate dehydrogenase
MALDISKLMEPEEFYGRLESMIGEMKSLKKSPWAGNIWIPGEKAWLTMQTRLKIGIPLHPNIVEELKNIASKVGTKFDIEVVEEHLT